MHVNDHWRPLGGVTTFYLANWFQIKQRESYLTVVLRLIRPRPRPSDCRAAKAEAAGPRRAPAGMAGRRPATGACGGDCDGGALGQYKRRGH